MFYRKLSDFNLYSKLKYLKLVLDGAVKEEFHDTQEVREWNPCKGGEMRLLFVSSRLSYIYS